MILLAACTDYNVSHSKLQAEAETGERELADGEDEELMVTLHADAEALSVPASSEVQLSIFAANEGGSPTIFTLAVTEEATEAVAPTTLFDLTVPDVLDGCEEGDASVITTERARSGACTAWFPIYVSSTGGDLSYQIELHAQLDYGSARAPGHLTVMVE